MRITATIEKSKDNLYSVYSDDHFGNSYFGGFGDSAREAREDFELSVREALQEAKERGEDIPSIEEITITYKYDIRSLFSYFDFINVSKLASYAGINESKMRQYKAGSSFPGSKTTAKIEKALHKIGEEFISLQL